MHRTLSLLAVVAFAGCSTVTAPASDILTATPRAQALEIRSTSTEKVYYFVADRGALALIDFTICRDPSKCEAVAPGATKQIAYSGIIGHSPISTELVLYHWHLVPAAGGTYDQDSIRSTIVPIK